MTPEAEGRLAQLAIEEIERKTNIDLHTVQGTKFPRLKRLFQLQKLAAGLPEPIEIQEVLNDENEAEGNFVDLDEVLYILRGTKGIGPALMDKIEEALKEALE